MGPAQAAEAGQAAQGTQGPVRGGRSLLCERSCREFCVDQGGDQAQAVGSQHGAQSSAGSRRKQVKPRHPAGSRGGGGAGLGGKSRLHDPPQTRACPAGSASPGPAAAVRAERVGLG